MLSKHVKEYMHSVDAKFQPRINSENPEKKAEQPEISLRALALDLEQELQNALYSGNEHNEIKMGPFIADDVVVNFFTHAMNKVLREKYPQILIHDTEIDGEVRTIQREHSADGANCYEYRYLMILHIQSPLDPESLNISFDYEFIGDGVHPNVRSLTISSFGDEKDFFELRNVHIKG